MMFYGPTRGYDPSAHLAASDARTTARDAARETEYVRFDIERLLMITEALWLIVRDELKLTDDQLQHRVEEIDLRDGKLDGKVASSGPGVCPSCNRGISKRHARCLYCGQDIAPELFGR